MNKLIVLLIIVSYSCTMDKATNNIQVSNTKTERSNGLSKQLINPYIENEDVEEQKIEAIHNNVIERIRPNMSNDSVNSVLVTVEYWDQLYRDSMFTDNKYISDEIKLWKYSKKQSRLDKMNQKIVLHLLNTVGSWPDTRDMSDEANIVIWLVIRHSSDEIEFKQQILPYLNQAFSDSIINNTYYASAFDGVYYTLHGRYKYGTYPFAKEYYPDTVINEINIERLKIGLDKI